MNTWRNNKGFTMVEIMVIVVVIAIIAALTLPSFGNVMDRLKLKTAGRDIVSALRFARSAAVSQKDQFGVYFNQNARNFLIFKDIANPASFTFDLGADSVIKIIQLPKNVNFGYTSIPGPAIIFKPNGSSYISGQVYLSSYGQYNGYLTVDVLGSTGRVKITSGDVYVAN
jgi:prepilin-type N-terminal cleavage/methylation domain-containing protein